MILYLETLEALARTGTMSRAGTTLRITQSAVSKRIQALEDATGLRLIEPEGRRVILTPAGRRLLERAAPALADLRLALTGDAVNDAGRLVLGVSESILATWGADLLTAALRGSPDLKIEVHAHRSPVVIDRILAGEYHLGLVAGTADSAPDLKVQSLKSESMVVILADEAPRKRGAPLHVMAIEPRSATWQSLARRLRQENVVVDSHLESFVAIGKLAQAGYAHGLVPEGVAELLRIPEARLYRFPRNRVVRPISLIGRPTALGRPSVEALCELLGGLASQAR